jgi:hypothetical protein
MQRPLLEHVETFIAEWYAIGRDEKYVRELRKKLLVLAAEVPWKYISDITAESFCAWRRKQKKSPKTLNEYLSAIGALLHRLEPVIGPNPLRFVERVQIAVESKRKRRAYSVDELRRLIAASGERGIIYLVAVSTGIPTRGIAKPGMARRRLRRGAAVHLRSEIDCKKSQRRKATAAAVRGTRVGKDAANRLRNK